MIEDKASGVSKWRVAGWGGAVALLLTPLIAMRFTSEVNWTLSDFVVMGAMIGAVGLALEFLVRRSGRLAYRAGAAVMVGTIFLLIWVNLAVGFLGGEANPANLMFAGVVAVAVGGAVLARFRAAGMARAMLWAAAAQAAVAVVALGWGLGSSGGAGWYEAIMGTTLFGGLWLAAAWLFGRAAAGHGNEVFAKHV